MRFPFNATIQLIQNHATGADWRRLFRANVAKREWLYRAYLKSAAWKKKREERITIDNHHCAKCLVNASHLEVHHKTYARIGDEDVESDLIALCGPCHRAVHKL